MRQVPPNDISGIFKLQQKHIECIPIGFILDIINFLYTIYLQQQI